MRDAAPWTPARLHLFKDSITLVPIFLFINFRGTNHMQNTTCLLLCIFSAVTLFWQIEYSLLCPSLVPWQLFVFYVFGILSRYVRYPVSSCWLYYFKTQELHGSGPQTSKSLLKQGMWINKSIRDFINVSSKRSSHDPNQYYKAESWDLRKCFFLTTKFWYSWPLKAGTELTFSWTTI